MCKKERENIYHFILGCEKLEHKRNWNLLKKYEDNNQVNMIGNLLFTKEDIEEVKKQLETLWMERKWLLANLNSGPEGSC